MAFKVSIRINILTAFTLLLVVIGSVIILVNYYACNTILVNFAEKLIISANDNIDQKITAFLSPFHERINFGANTIKNKLIKPIPSPAFTKFLLQLLANQPDFYAAHWGMPNGDFYVVQHNFDLTGTFTGQIISCKKQQCLETTQLIDQNGNILSQTSPHPINFDLHNRPWYVKTIKTKHYTLSNLYTFYDHPTLGLTAAYPIYDTNNNLYGTLGIDISLRSLSDFVTNLKLTKDSNTFVFTEDGSLVATKTLQKYAGRNVPKINDIEVPWVTASFIEYKKTGQGLFSYNHNGQKYLAYYDTIQDIIDNPWYIAIVLPEKDITAALTQTLKRSILVAIGVLLLGIFFVSLIAKNISKPIVRLTKDARLINNLELDKVQYPKLSYIKEISFLQEAFLAMKQGLTSFIRYVPFTLVKKLIATGDIAHTGGESKELTFMFIDIEGFTSISEKMEPQQLTRYLSEYLEAMTKIIIDHQGTLDKYIGDAIMAFWGAPSDDSQHPLHACQCAIEILNELKKLNQQWQETQQPTMKLRLGIHTGNAVVGNVGSKDRLSYTVIGDSVNLASRLENLNKLYKTTVIVSATTYLLTKDNYKFRLLDNVSVRGKNIGGYIYELVDSSHNFDEYNLKDYSQAFYHAFISYQKGNWDAAINAFTNLAKLYPNDNLIEIYLERCRQFKNNPPIDWQGIWRLT